MNVSAPTAAAAAVISSSVASGFANAMLSRIEPAKRKPSCGHDAELPAQALLGHVAEIVLVDRDAALARVVEARKQLGDRRFPCAGVADQRDGRAGGDVEVDAVQDLGPVAVAEAHGVEADAADHGGERHCAGPVLDLGLLLHQVDDLVERRDGREEGVVELGELLHRVEEVRQVADEREERSDRQRPVEDEVASEPEDDRGGRRRQQVDEREVDAVENDGLVVGRAVARAYLAEALVGLRLAGEGLDDAHPGDVLLQRGGDQAEPLADAAIRARRAPAEDRRGDAPSAGRRRAWRARGASRAGRG